MLNEFKVTTSKERMQAKMAGWMKAQKQHHQNSPSSNIKVKKPLREVAYIVVKDA